MFEVIAVLFRGCFQNINASPRLLRSPFILSSLHFQPLDSFEEQENQRKSSPDIEPAASLLPRVDVDQSYFGTERGLRSSPGSFGSSSRRWPSVPGIRCSSSACDRPLR